MKIVLSIPEAERVLANSVTFPEFTSGSIKVEIATDAPSGGVPVVNFEMFLSTVNQVIPSEKIASIKAVRQFFADNGLFIGLGDAKNFIETIINIKNP